MKILILLCFLMGGLTANGLTTLKNPYTPVACTPDINQWGHPTSCVCGDEGAYNEMNGLCYLQHSPVYLCTPDINSYGHPTACVCVEGYRYNELKGTCDLK